MNNLNPYQRDIITRTILGEAAGEDVNGKAAVAHVLMNRSRDPRWPGDPAQVALQPKQFSAWNAGAGGNDLVRKYQPGSPEYDAAAHVVDQVISGQIPDPTKGATHYYSPKGMNMLVEQGHQQNNLPRWLPEENQRRGGESLTLGNHIFTGLAGEGQAGGVQSTPFPPMGGPGTPQPKPQPPVPPSGGQTDPFNAWLNKKIPWLADDDNRDKLFALGQGLLSSSNFSDGFSAGLNNIHGLQQEKQDHYQQQMDEYSKFEQELYKQDQRISSQVSTRAQYPGNVRMKDGSVRGDLSWYSDGTYRDAQGNDLSDQVDIRINNSDASGSKGQMSYRDAARTQSELMMQKAGLEAIGRVQDYLSKDPAQGLGKVMQNVSATYQTLLGKGLTEEQIETAIATGDMQALIGQTREAVVGPGVMSEQDAVRVMAALGGDLKSILNNPDAFKARLEVVFLAAQS